MKTKYEVVQIIPSTTYVTYHVEATSKEEAEQLIENQDKSIVKISERSEDNEWERIEYNVEHIDKH